MEQGNDVGMFYDPLLGKLIVWGETRERAIARMRRALDEFVLVGLPTSQPFHRRVLAHPDFVAGTYDIGFLERHGDALLAVPPSAEALQRAALAAALAEHEARQAARPAREALAFEESAWVRAARLGGLR